MLDNRKLLSLYCPYLTSDVLIENILNHMMTRNISTFLFAWKLSQCEKSFIIKAYWTEQEFPPRQKINNCQYN